MIEHLLQLFSAFRAAFREERKKQQKAAEQEKRKRDYAVDESEVWTPVGNGWLDFPPNGPHYSGRRRIR